MDIVFWIDVVGEGQNENAIFARPFNDKGAFPQKLTNKKHNIKNNFHGNPRICCSDAESNS